MLELAARNAIREKSILGQPLAIYGFMEIARELRKMNPEHPPLERVARLGEDTDFFDIDNQIWKDLGVMVPEVDTRTLTIKGYKPRNTFQSRRALADAMVRRMVETDAPQRVAA